MCLEIVVQDGDIATIFLSFQNRSLDEGYFPLGYKFRCFIRFIYIYLSNVDSTT